MTNGTHISIVPCIFLISASCILSRHSGFRHSCSSGWSQQLLRPVVIKITVRDQGGMSTSETIRQSRLIRPFVRRITHGIGLPTSFAQVEPRANDVATFAFGTESSGVRRWRGEGGTRCCQPACQSAAGTSRSRTIFNGTAPETQ